MCNEACATKNVQPRMCNQECPTKHVQPSMSNEELIRSFEGNTLPDGFRHADHVRLTFAYLSEYPVLGALEKFSSALKRFAAARGKTQLYHETITCACFFLIHERMARCQGADWEGFAIRNPDLLLWKSGILSRYYTEGTLKSDLARNVFVLPDKGLETDNEPKTKVVGGSRPEIQPRNLAPKFSPET